MVRDIPQFQTQSLPGLLRYWAERHPDRLAFREKRIGVWNPITFREYYENTKDFALGLAELGVGRGDFLAVASEDTPEWMYADLAIQSLGGACIGIYPTNPWSELRYILEHSGAKVVVCGDQEQTDKVLDAIKFGGPLPQLRKIICVDMKGMGRYERGLLTSFDEVTKAGRARRAGGGQFFEDALEAIKPDDVGVIVYTSGTTGMPKGAMLTHAGLIGGGVCVAERYGINESNWEVLAYLPLCHVAERLFSTVMQLVNGSTVNFSESIDAVTGNLREIAPTAFLGVPRIWEKLQHSISMRSQDATRFQQWVLCKCLELGRPIAQRQLAAGGVRVSTADRVLFAVLYFVCFRALQKYMGLDRARTCVCGGASISPDVLEFFWTIGLQVYQAYGQTEISGISHCQYPGHTELGSAGTPLPGYSQRLTDDGEILVRGVGMFKGYLNDADASAAALRDGWLHTGDIGVIGPDGSIRIADRKKDIIITSGGKNITPSLIENRLRDSIYVREAVLIGERRNFLSALIQIDYESVGKWAQERGLAYTTYRSLAERAEVRELVANVVENVNRDFSRVENVRKFVILQKELDHDDGEVTATMKVRRSTIEKKFKSEIDQIYQS